MEKCNDCGKTLKSVGVHITDNNGTHVLCHCCLAIREQDSDVPTFENNMDFIDDISGRHGAVKYESGNESYSLDKAVLRRLVFRHLTPNEWKILSNKYSPHNHALHEDFYDDNGIALQPNDEDFVEEDNEVEMALIDANKMEDIIRSYMSGYMVEQMINDIKNKASVSINNK